MSIEVLLDHYGKDKPALTLNQEETVKAAVVTPEMHMDLPYTTSKETRR